MEIRRVELLEGIYSAIESLQWAAQFADPEMRLQWVSEEFRKLLGTDDPKELGYGRHVVETYMSEPFRELITPESAVQAIATDLPYYFHSTPGGKDAVVAMFPEEFRAQVATIEPAVTPPVWVGTMDYLQDDLPPVSVSYVSTAVTTPDGEFLGFLRIFGPALRAELIALLARGDTAMFERMARIREPRRRRAAMVFADMQGSSALSRRLSSPAYFSLIRRLFTAIDDLVVKRGGIVGKHAGDGVTAFFLSEDLGSDSSAATAALEAARQIRDVVEGAVQATDGLIGPGDCLFNIGVHWGGALYMGQVVTGGRIEVTALGDEVHEGARVQQAARGGHLFATKHLIEQLTEDHARGLGIDAERLVYTMIVDLPDAPEKSRRDAGGVPVVEVFPAGARAV
jgi:class 3 adenylate cyclase